MNNNEHIDRTYEKGCTAPSCTTTPYYHEGGIIQIDTSCLSNNLPTRTEDSKLVTKLKN